ncbi:MAG TPA: N-acetylmuramoyl-L-alanine amidase [Anaerolineales bacterium]|nr:N-acetylmuramoyl-L-alanine amidase [Anaerolineales bacterium]HNN13909.1 N-acetylmuramoyl-L-alanine amidase [Anaerolineales bacterium]HNO30469.1 N-acetylmuramoyl-L-alanine amidase [Anaerolineales bacterium]
MESKNERPTPRRNRNRSSNAFFSTLGVAILIATLFTAWTPTSLFASNLQEKLNVLLTPQPEPVNSLTTPQPQIHIGIVAGHMGNDSGAVCTDENGTVTLTEADVNLKIATLVQESLNARGFQVELLNEFDTRLNGYRAAALVSIHNDSCEYVNDEATGFKVAASLETRDANRAQRLTACMVDRYGQITGLTFHANSITADMTQYHAFSEIDPNTITAIIETGFLNLDRRILTEQTDVIAEGVTQGILCFINNESVLPDQFPLPTILP